MTDSTHEFLEILGKIMLRCWIFGFLLLLLWFGGFMSGVVYEVHGPLMYLTKHDLNVIHYCGMAFAKLVVI